MIVKVSSTGRLRSSTAVDGEARAVEGAWRAYGGSKDHRPDLPQVVIGMAVTREGIGQRDADLAARLDAA